jgi:hypothetical protein
MFQFQQNFDGPFDKGPLLFDAWMRQRERSERKPRKSRAFCAAFLKKRQDGLFQVQPVNPKE